MTPARYLQSKMMKVGATGVIDGATLIVSMLRTNLKPAAHIVQMACAQSRPILKRLGAVQTALKPSSLIKGCKNSSNPGS